MISASSRRLANLPRLSRASEIEPFWAKVLGVSHSWAAYNFFADRAERDSASMAVCVDLYSAHGKAILHGGVGAPKRESETFSYVVVIFFSVFLVGSSLLLSFSFEDLFLVSCVVSHTVQRVTSIQ